MTKVALSKSLNRYMVECSSCKAQLSMVTIFGEVYHSRARGVSGTSEFYSIKVDSCARCSDATKRKAIEFELASNLISLIKSGASTDKLLNFLKSIAPKGKDFTQADYPVHPGEPPSYEDMAEHIPFLKPQATPFRIKLKR